MEPYFKKDQNFENWLKFQLEFVFNTNIKNLNDLKITNSLSFDLDASSGVLYNSLFQLTKCICSNKLIYQVFKNIKKY